MVKRNLTRVKVLQALQRADLLKITFEDEEGNLHSINVKAGTSRETIIDLLKETLVRVYDKATFDNLPFSTGEEIDV